MRYLFVHKSCATPAIALDYAARTQNLQVSGFPHPTLWFFYARLSGIIPFCREGEEYNTREGNHSGRLTSAFEPPGTHCRPAWANLKN
nr:MAG TPA: hypothetical protein [Caudoviricetes sp.]